MYYDENTIIYYKGKFIKAADAKANVYDQSLHYGYGVFEGIRSYEIDGEVKIFKAREHFERLEFSAKSMAIPYPYSNDELIEITYEVLKRNKLTNAYIRPLITCTPNMQLTKGKASELLIAAWDWGAYLGNNLLNVGTSSFRRPNPAAFKIGAKVTGHYVNSILACQEAKNNGYDEALLLDVEGFVAEGPGANFFVEKDNVLYTPQLGNILPGITRATVIELCEKLDIPVIEKQVTPGEVHGADSAFFCGTAAEIVGIASLDAIPFKKQWNETQGFKIQKAYKNLVTEKEEFQTAIKNESLINNSNA